MAKTQTRAAENLKPENPKPGPDYTNEKACARRGPVIGIDEAGRGPWAGPVTAAAFWINPEQLDRLPAQLTDSKKLTARQRAEIEAVLTDERGGHIWAVRHEGVGVIDRLGILKATFSAMTAAGLAVQEALKTRLGPGPLTALIDGNLTPDAPFHCIPLIKGDARSLSVAAASILAKQSRDRVMEQLATLCPGYGWQTNAGYGTKAHEEAIDRLGVSLYHRTSFAPIKNRLQRG